MKCSLEDNAKLFTELFTYVRHGKADHPSFFILFVKADSCTMTAIQYLA